MVIRQREGDLSTGVAYNAQVEQTTASQDLCVVHRSSIVFMDEYSC